MRKLYYIASQFLLLYRISPKQWLLIMLIFLVVWTVLMLALRSYHKLTTGLNLGLMLLGLGIIFLVTFARRSSVNRRIVSVPLRPLFGIKTPRDYWHVTIMNLLVYVPFACGLTFCLEKRVRHPAGITVLICFLMSVAAEALQYVLGSGTCEVDDVLMNTLGALLSTLPYTVWRREIR